MPEGLTCCGCPQNEPKPDLKPRDVRIKILTAAINRAEAFQRQGTYPPPPGASKLLGLECCGIITEVWRGFSCSYRESRVNACHSNYRASKAIGSLRCGTTDGALLRLRHLPATYCAQNGSFALCTVLLCDLFRQLLSPRRPCIADRAGGEQMEGRRARDGALGWRRLRRGGEGK